MAVVLSHVKNPPFASDISSGLHVQMSTSSGYLIAEGTSAAISTELPAVDLQPLKEVSVSAANPTPGESTSYEIIFETGSDVPQGSTVTITLPSDVSQST